MVRDVFPWKRRAQVGGPRDQRENDRPERQHEPGARSAQAFQDDDSARLRRGSRHGRIVQQSVPLPERR